MVPRSETAEQSQVERARIRWFGLLSSAKRSSSVDRETAVALARRAVRDTLAEGD